VSGKKGEPDETRMKLLEEDLRSQPSVTYMRRRADLLYELLGVRVGRATACRMVKRLGYTRKKRRDRRFRNVLLGFLLRFIGRFIWFS